MTEAVNAADGDTLSPAEQAYFELGGVATDALVVEAGEAEKGRETVDPNAGEAPVEQPEQPADDVPSGGDDGKPKNPGQWVRHGALHAERERRKKVEAELQSERELRARYDERLRLLDDLSRPKAAAPRDEVPDPEADIFGYVRHLERKVAGVEGKIGESLRTTEAQRADAELRDIYAADAQAFAATTPDFTNAYQHLLMSRNRELEMMGEADPQRRMAQIIAEERGLALQAIRKGISPSAQVYELAKTRGYRGGDPMSPAPAGGRDGRPSVSGQIETIARGQAAAKSLSNVGGSAGATITPEALASMTDDEFNALFSRLSRAKQRELLGG